MKLLLSFNDNNDKFYSEFIKLLITNVKLLNNQGFIPTIYLDIKTVTTLYKEGLQFNFILTDRFTKHINTEIFWAFNKLILLSQQTEPYLYIDYDLFAKDMQNLIETLPKDKITFTYQDNKSEIDDIKRWEYAFDTIITKVKKIAPWNEFFNIIESESQFNASLISVPTKEHAIRVKEVAENLISFIRLLDVADIPFNDRGNMCVFEQFPFYYHLKDDASVLYKSNPNYPPLVEQDIVHLTYLKYNVGFIDDFIKKALSGKIFK